ncbi:PAS domain-containing protein, partial [Clostridium sp. AM58-1XD]|uniref:PAS domain-containing protein n=1 Tax=Clostridium sp. AM58-1XD TaxID=2292307 RepID=UPI000E4E9C0D
MDKQTVLIYPGYTSIIDSLKAAKSVAMELRKERRKNQYFQAMFESGINGFLLLDREFHVIDYNKRASDLFENEADELKNMDFSRLFPELDLKDFAKRRPAEESGTVRREKKELYYRIVKMENRDSAFEGAVVELAETCQG